MTSIEKILHYLNPFSRLGEKQYSIVFPFLFTLLSAFLLELYTHEILKNPSAVEAPAVIIFLGLIIYFAFHDGIRGGLAASVVTIIYYFYIIYSREYAGQKFINDIETSIALGILYVSLTIVIGGLKQKTDKLLERTANEKKWLQTIIQQMPTGIIVTDKDGKITHTNKQIELIVGNKIPIGAILGKNKTLVPETYNLKLLKTPFEQVLKAGKTITKQEYLIQRKDNTKRHIQLSASPIFEKNHQIIATVATVTDITQQKENEQKKDDFVNIASHELRTPITSLKLYVNSLSSRIKKYKDVQATNITKSIQYQTDRLQELVTDLLDVSRLQTGKMVFKKEQFFLNELLKETLENLRPITRRQTIIFSDNISQMVSADKFRIQQVIINLITNAIKYSSSGTEIVVRLKKENAHTVVSVQDTGIGIPKEQQKKIFDRLYQVTDTKEKTFPGLGIGLYISQQIIKRHRGHIWVESEKGKGSTFFFSLPLLKKNNL